MSPCACIMGCRQPRNSSARAALLSPKRKPHGCPWTQSVDRTGRHDMDTRTDPNAAPYNEGQPPMARTGLRRMLIIGLGAFVLIIGAIVVNTRQEIQESQPATTQSQPVAPKQ